MRTTSRRLGALVAASALAVTGVSLVATPAQASAAPRPVSIGADWLAGQLVDGLLPGDFGSLYGPSIDAALSLKAAGGHDADVTAIGTAIGNHITDYTEYDYTFNGHFTGQAAGPTAKALVLAQNLPTPTTTLGGVDLLTRLEGFVSTTAPTTGRLIGVSQKDGVDDPADEYTNVVGQALGVRALHAAASDKTAAAVAFLVKQQCAAGFFRVDFNYDKTATDQTCDGGATGTSDPDTDATAAAVRALAELGDSTGDVGAALTKAETWLLANQNADGSFGGGTSTAAANTNSTATAGLALAALGDFQEATKAAAWVRARQADEVAACSNALSTETGAIAYNPAALTAGLTDGITAAKSQEWRIAASQALPVLAYVPDGEGPYGVNGPTGFVKAGTTASYKVIGAAPGEKVCVSAAGFSRRVVAGATGRFNVAVPLPAGTADRTLTATSASGPKATWKTRVLGTKTLKVAAPATAKKGKNVTVVVSGLASGEDVNVTFRGKTKRTGTANSKGVSTVVFNVGTTLGNGTVKAFGRYADIRKGFDIVKVVK